MKFAMWIHNEYDIEQTICFYLQKGLAATCFADSVNHNTKSNFRKHGNTSKNSKLCIT